MFDDERAAGGVRGQSDVLGFVLLVGIVLALSFSVVVVGSGALDDARSASESQDAAMSLLAMQSQIDDLNPDEGTTHRLSFAGSLAGGAAPAPGANVEGGNTGGVRVDPSAGRINITTKAGTTIVNRTLGSIEYVKDGAVIGYQGGGVFRSTTGNENSIVESPPPIDYRDGSGEATMSVPVRYVSTESGDALSGTEFTFEAKDTATEFSPDTLGRKGTAIEWAEGGLSIEIQSEYYRAWGGHLEHRTGVTPSYNASENEVSIELRDAGPGAANADTVVGVDWVQVPTTDVEFSPD